MQREIITIHVKMDRQTFRRFALFDTFRLKKRWCKPALFCAILLVFAAVAFAAGREQSALIGSVLLLVGLGLPAVYVGTYLSQLNAQAKKLRLDPPRPVYTLRLAQEGVTIQNDMKAGSDRVARMEKHPCRMAGQGLHLSVRHAGARLFAA